MLPVIQNRRSIRKFLDKPIPREVLEEILQAGALAPSASNRQPWRFIVASGAAKKELTDAMERGLERERREPLLPARASASTYAGAERTRQIMVQAPVVILAMNPLALPLEQPLTIEERVYDVFDTQSYGAALENICLAAENLGVGSLWIGFTFFAYHELKEWAGGPGELYAALALGYPDETPLPRPRKPLEEIVEWRIDS